MTTAEHTLSETRVTARRLDSPHAEALCLPGKPRLDVGAPLPLPGVIIFVHGVNSTGEWFDDAEEGLCKGLNTRLQRNDDQLHCIKGSGQLKPMRYQNELTDDGYIKDDIKAHNFVIAGSGCSPIIRFRWGYKASAAELGAVGGDILLDEHNAWGGGPFVNGCSALPDLFDKGTHAEFLGGFLKLNDLQTSDRQIYNAPARHYQAFAAWRLAKLVARIREVHRECYGKDCPITVVCHSQGNMVGLTSAYFGAHHTEFGGNPKSGTLGLGVADTYILANAPYSLRGSRVDNFTQRNSTTGLGRVTLEARIAGLKNFFDIVRHFQPQAWHYNNDYVTQHSHNSRPRNGDTACTAKQDCQARDTRGRVFLYCCPHDRVVSVSTVQGMGWLGLDKSDIESTHAQSILYQRVWAQTKPGVPFKVGAQPGEFYDYWEHTIGATPAHTNSGWDDTTGRYAPENSKPPFWDPPSENMSVMFGKTLSDDRASLLGKTGFTVVGGVVQGGIWLASPFTDALKVNANPDTGWRVLVNAPAVPSGGIEPRALYLPSGSTELRPEETRHTDGTRVNGPFNRRTESARDALNPKRGVPEGQHDPYATQRETGRGNASSEASMRYDQNAGLRQLARRKLYDKQGTLNTNVPFGEADIGLLSEQGQSQARSVTFSAYEQQSRQKLIKAGDDQQATNHSTILTNPAHAEHVLAYDVDVGVCWFNENLMNQFRRMADWRWCKPEKGEKNNQGEMVGADYYPQGRKADKDQEFEYYVSAKYEKSPLANNDKFDASKGAVTAIHIPDERNTGLFDAHHAPKGAGPHYA
ncbi:T6SS effector phospholipase Tle3 domain-containing protein [Ralstonia sp. UBA689]|uniref:T6SS effector phospholipase Tle3 domain-containing protein n=1 Tax=Ralstonia sp. UBA689 TaxID=1947373 RepID=UPI0025E6AA42|nr:DUF3274 domain-containing protein [Ralstonia sp. UBA689]